MSDPLGVCERWDSSLRAGDWELARSLLADEATYIGFDSDPKQPTCSSGDEIVGLMRSWKGKLPDVEVILWEVHGDQVLAQLRQPAWGEDSDWFQLLTTSGDRIVRLEDHGTKVLALAALD